MTGRTPSSRVTTPLTIAQALRLPATVDLMTAARALRLSRNKAYSLAHENDFPCRVIRIGDMYRVPTAELLAVLGIDPAELGRLETDGASQGGGRDDDA